MITTVYVHLIFTVPQFSSGNLWEKNLDKKFCPKTVRELDRYEILGIWQYENYHSIYCTVYLDRSCLIGTISITTLQIMPLSVMLCVAMLSVLMIIVIMLTVTILKFHHAEFHFA
jgi:hypothetical protein